MTGKKYSQMYIYQPNEHLHQMNTLNSDSEVMLWHKRLGYLNVKTMGEMARQNIVHGLNIKTPPPKLDCDVCYKSKIHVEPFPKKATQCTKGILELVHTDICGPMRIDSCGGSRYFVLFIDDYSRMMFV